MYRLKQLLRSLVPASLIAAYHFSLAYVAALTCGFPSRRIRIIAVTGTKGKSSTTEMINAILEEAGYTTALVNSIRIKTGKRSVPNLLRMSMPGRFFIQRFLRNAADAKCTAAILEMTSEGARQHRHRGIDLDALVFTNLAPEHIESHGSYKAYADAKFELGRQLVRSRKRPRIIVANADDAESARYLALPVEKVIPFSLSTAEPYTADDRGAHFRFGDSDITIAQPGIFSIKNALAAAALARSLGISTSVIARALGKLTHIPGRGERIEAGQDFAVIVDYAHTPDSLEAIYRAYGMPKVCVLGSMGGSRDTWNRPEKARIAAKYCRQVILTNEDPCDDDPRKIVEEMSRGVPAGAHARIILERREAIHAAICEAKKGEAVLITGKGTDPWIYGARGERIPWSDAQVAREELEKLLHEPRV